jgi:serine/threonine protein phosphatase PrpC
VLGSDGLWDNFNNSEVADLVGHALDRNETAAGLASM